MKKKAFTLVELLIAVILVGLSIASLVAANISFTKANGVGANSSTAEFLVEQIRELTTLLPLTDPLTDDTFGPEEPNLAGYDDLDDFDGATFSPPINADREILSDLSAFSQQVTVENVSASDFDQVVGDLETDFVRVTVEVFFNSGQIRSAAWLRARH